ncbi:MAG TPA: restriction endonuclease subunit S [Candidatus Binatia bacterium]|nr:restriction endonuclease subunit S [Candidatus Binatia bacterium]
MAGEWVEESFSEVIDFQEGPGILAKDFRDQGVPLVRLSGLERGASVLSGCNYLDPEMVAKRWSHFALAKGDILLSTSASLGRIAVVGDEAVGAIPYTGIIRMRPRDQRLVAEFIRYLLEGPGFQRQAEMVGAGSVIRHFGPMHLRQMTVTIPPPEEQRAIAHILGTLDDKIELNRRMSETLEAMARALFKSWFVDFDPVRAKAEGRDPGLPKPLADLFPARLVDSELGEIPEGWEVATFGDVVEQLRDNLNPLDFPDVVFRHFSIPAFDDGQWPVSELGASIKSQKSLVPPGTLLLSKLNPEIERVWLVDVQPEDRAVCSTEFLVLAPRAPFGRAYAYCAARSPGFRQELEGLVTGTSKSHQRAHASAILGLAVVRPRTAISTAFERIAGPLIYRALECRRESHSLAALRDALLPKLISGELRVKDAERFIERADA